MLNGWLEASPYPASRRREVRNAATPLHSQTVLDGLEKLLRRLRVSVFIKDEPYPSDAPHRPRLIVSRDDAYKGLFGPFFKPIENAFFSLPETIKHHPVQSRPRIITAKLDQAASLMRDPVYVGIDYSSYESCQTADVMRNGEWAIYEHAWHA